MKIESAPELPAFPVFEFETPYLEEVQKLQALVSYDPYSFITGLHLMHTIENDPIDAWLRGCQEFYPE